jgi:hypothetical protein
MDGLHGVYGMESLGAHVGVCSRAGKGVLSLWLVISRSSRFRRNFSSLRLINNAFSGVRGVEDINRNEWPELDRARTCYTV